MLPCKDVTIINIIEEECKIFALTLLQIHYMSQIHYITYTTPGKAVIELLYNYFTDFGIICIGSD